VVRTWVSHEMYSQNTSYTGELKVYFVMHPTISKVLLLFQLRY